MSLVTSAATAAFATVGTFCDKWHEQEILDSYCVRGVRAERGHAQTNVWKPSPGHTQIPIWPGAVPDAGKQPVTGPEDVTNVTTTVGTRWTMARNVTLPTMTIYSPQGTNAGIAVVVFPGGGYQCLAMHAHRNGNVVIGLRTGRRLANFQVGTGHLTG